MIRRIINPRRLAATGLAMLMASTVARAQTSSPAGAGPKVVNIINFIRGVEPRANVDLLEPVRQQIALAKSHGLPTTFLLQYDALINPDFVNLLKSQLGPNDEIGAWLEVVQPEVEAAGMVWRGATSWDPNTAVGLTQSYAPADRNKLMDVYMAKFKDTFGKYPASVGCWVLDAPTLNYLYDQYHIVAACNCKDQSGTDGYTLWGGYWNQAYYPSRSNAYMPAQSAEQQLNVPIFRMLGSDPIYQYDLNLGGTQGVVSLEPIYSPGGNSPTWVNKFFQDNFNAPCLAFAYTQVGQENSFGWPAMSSGLTNQYQVLTDGVANGTLKVQTLGQSGAWYRSNFDKTPATAVVALTDTEGSNHKSVWYESRYYRVNLYWEGNIWRIRDLHIFNETYAERYMKDHVTGQTCTYDTLPALDGNHWSTANNLAGIRPLIATHSGTRQLLSNGAPTVTEVGTDSLLVTMPVTTGGTLEIHCTPAALTIDVTGAGAPTDWGMELGWDGSQPTSIVNFTPQAIGYQHNNFGYALRTRDATISQGGTASSFLIRPAAQALTFDFDPSDSTAYWDLNGSTTGTGAATASGTWDAATANWNPITDGTGTPVVWQGTGHIAVFAAGSDATGAYTVNVSGTQTADGVIVKQGDVTLSGGTLNLTTPAVLRAEAGASLTVGSQLAGTAGLLFGGDGAIHLSGTNPISGPLGVTVGSLSMTSGTSFPALSDLSLASNVNLAAGNSTLGLTGSLNLNGANFTGSGTTVVNARNVTLTAASSASTLTLADTAAINLTSPSPAQSTFELDGGALVLSGSSSLTTDQWLNRGSGLPHSLNVSDSAHLIVTDNLVLGDNSNAAITVTQTGGTVTNTGTTNNPVGDDASNRWGLWGGASTVYNISGGALSLTGAPLYLSWDGTAALNISGTATVTLRGVEMGWGGRSQNSTISLTGGRLNLGAAGLVSGSPTNKTITLGAGTLGATASWSSSLPMSVTAVTTVDSGSFDIALNGILSGSGSVTKIGSGSLSLNGANTLSGPVNANAGTVRIGAVSGVTVNVASAATIAPGLQASGTVGSLNLANGSQSSFRIGGTPSTLTVATAGGLKTTGTNVVNVTGAAGVTTGTYPLFRYSGALGGNGFAGFALGATPHMTASLVNNTANSSVDLLVTAVDPAGASGVFIQELFDAIAGTPPGTDASLNGKGNTASSIGLTGNWLTNGNTGIFAASNFDVGANLPGLLPSNGVTGGLWNNTGSYATTIYATRALAKPVNFAADQTIYFSFCANNSGDTAMGVGFAAGPGGAAEFVGAGLSWNNARAIATGANDSGNAAYIGYGTLSGGSGPYGIRAHEPAGSINDAALIVGRLTLHASGADAIDIKRYSAGDTIDSDPSAVTWSASDSVSSTMSATHLLLWLNGVNNGAAGELDAIRVGASWSDVTGALSAYDAWASGPPYYLTGSDALPGADPDHDGIPNALEFVLGGNPATGDDRAKLPTAVVVGTNMEFTFRRADISNTPPLPFVEYGSDLTGWTAAQDGANGVAVVVTDNFYNSGIDRVVVKIPQALAAGQKMFVRLNANR